MIKKMVYIGMIGWLVACAATSDGFFGIPRPNSANVSYGHGCTTVSCSWGST